jgi:hypothetical protein
VLVYEELDENRPNVRLFTHYEHLHYPVNKTPLIGLNLPRVKPMNNETHATYSDQAFASVMGNVYIVTGKLSS